MTEVLAKPSAATGDLEASAEHLRAGAFGWKSLTLMGVSFTAAGCYAPWSFGIDAAGWAGMLVAFCLVGAFYYCLAQCLAEMSAAIPSSGAGQAFAHRALGSSFGFAAGSASLVQWVCGSSALAVLMAAYVHSITGLESHTIIIAAYAVLVGILLTGAGEVMVLTLSVSLLAVAGALSFVGLSLPNLSSHSFDGFTAHPVTLSGVWLALPFAVTFFLGLEGVPFAAEEARNPAKDLPIGLNLSFLTVALTGGLVLLFGPAGYGLAHLAGSEDPLLSGLRAGSGGIPPAVIVAVSLAAVAGLATSLFSSIFAYSRQVFAMARDAELPAFLGHLSPRGVPVAALVLPSAISLVVALTGALAQVIVVMVFAACLSYGTMFVSFLALRRHHPNLVRPFRLRGGAMTATLGLVLGSVVFAACVASDPVWSAVGGAMVASLLIYREVSRRGSR